jgi:signal transduction histidine kinase/ligand-binding sensor domain-containing protein
VKFALLFLLPCVCFALDPGLRLSQYHKKVWQIEDGLPHNYVNAIQYAPDGYLLVGTGEGLARFDGVRFTPLAGAASIERQWISALAPAAGGAYWISTYYQDLYRLENRNLRRTLHGQASMMGLFTDSTGALWISAGGILRLDAKGTVAVGIGSSAGNSWHVFAEDTRHRIWITAGGGLHCYENGKARLVVKDGGPHGSMLSVMAGPDGVVWAGTSNGLYRVRESTGTVTLERQPGVSGPVVKILRDKGGILWAGTWGQGLYRITAHGAENWSTRDGLSDDFIRTLFEDHDGNLWIGSRSGGLSRWKNPLVEPFGVPEGLGGNFASAVLEAEGGGLWMGTWRSGLFRLRGGVFERMPTPLPALDLGIRSLAGDGHGGLWLGTWEGLHHFDGKTYDPRIFIRGFVSALLLDRAGGLWVAGSSLRYFPNGNPGSASTGSTPAQRTTTVREWSPSPQSTPPGNNHAPQTASPDPTPLRTATGKESPMALPAAKVDEAAPQAQSRSVSDGLARASSTERATPQTSTGKLSPTSQQLGYGEKSALPLPVPERERRATSAPLLNPAPAAPESEEAGEPNPAPTQQSTSPDSGQLRLPNTNTNCLLQDRQGRIWAGTDSGVAVFENGRLTWIRREQGLADEYVTSLTEDTQGRIWASTRGGFLAFLRDGRATSLGPREGLPGHSLFKLLDDHAGSHWISSSRGILRIPSSQLEDVLAGRRKSVDAALYEQEDGLRTIECHGISQPSGWRDSEGNLWFPTAKGFVRIRPGKDAHPPAPPVRIEEILAGAQPLAEPVELQPGARDLEVRFTALRFSSPTHLRFRYRLEGNDPDWIQREGERSARYSTVPLGRHRLLVEAREPGGPWSEPVSVTIRQLPRFYQTAWFFTAVLLALAALGFAFYRWRMYVLRGRYKAVLAERNRISREWHDTLLAGFSAISWQLDATLTRLKEQPARAAEAVDVARQMVHHYRAEARRVIWDLRENDPVSESLQDAVARTMEQITAGTGVATRLEVSGAPGLMSSDLRQNALRICQEATANAVRHGKAANVQVGIQYTSESVKLRIRDDGAGFDPKRTLSTPSGHFGLIVMQERARRFGGALHIDSAPGSGTTVEADLPLQPSKPA